MENEESARALMERIDKMSHVEMARLWRFAPAGEPIFEYDSKAFRHFKERFMSFGGMTPEISKQIGHGR